MMNTNNISEPSGSGYSPAAPRSHPAPCAGRAGGRNVTPADALQPEINTATGQKAQKRVFKRKAAPIGIIEAPQKAKKCKCEITLTPDQFIQMVSKDTLCFNPEASYTISGNVTLSTADIKQLPNDLHITGFLALREYTSREKTVTLPENLKVDGDFDLRSNNISKLSGNISVTGSTNLTSCLNLESIEGLKNINNLLSVHDKKSELTNIQL